MANLRSLQVALGGITLITVFYQNLASLCSEVIVDTFYAQIFTVDTFYAQILYFVDTFYAQTFNMSPILAPKTVLSTLFTPKLHPFVYSA